MLLSRYPINTLKETPSEAEVVSHQLMLRAGLIRRIAAGIYAWLPLGLRTLRKVEAIVREEMDRAGALELLMPAIQPAELWQESGRWSDYGPELLRLTDRHERGFVVGPTHEEVITDIARRELKSYRQLPACFYQIQIKFRDEARPRFGVMRAREFVMKDAYSFHGDEASLAAGYAAMRAAYTRMFQRMQLDFRIVQADTGAIGGTVSEEFQVLAAAGEDAIAICDAEGFAANVELAPALPPAAARPAPSQPLARVATPGARTIAEVSALLGVSPSQCLKTLIVAGAAPPDAVTAGVTDAAAAGVPGARPAAQTASGRLVALVLRGDHELNAVKAQQLPGVARPLVMAGAAQMEAAIGAPPGSIGPRGLMGLTVYADHAALAVADFVCGANERDAHLTGVNWGRDLPVARAADLRNVVPGDPSPSGRGSLSIVRGIEVGHIFQLGRKYSAALGATVLDEAGAPAAMWMGCYGIGVSRIVAAAIEQSHDARGIIWPDPIAPFHVALVALNSQKSPAVRATADAVYAELGAAGIETLYDDRELRPGVKFADAELLGIPHRIVVSERGVAAGTLEYRPRRAAVSEDFPRERVVEFVRARLSP